MKKIYLKHKKEESILRQHPWIFSGAIDKVDANIEEGEKVEVYSSKKELLGIGHFAYGSIAVRMLCFEKRDIDQSFYDDRLLSAWQLRERAGLIRPNDKDKSNTAFRLIHGEGDNIPGLIVDIYGNTAVMQAHNIGIYRDREMIAKAIVSTSKEMETIEITAVYDKSENTIPKIEGLEINDGFLIGNNEAEAVFENGIKFIPDWLKGQKTGFFIDQRDNRSKVEYYANNRKVLNAFSYTGGFSVYALRGGAISVDSLDSSAKATYLAEQNVLRNFDESITKKHKSITEDAFKFLDDMKYGEYDMIVLDPPAFAKHRKVLRNALIGYRKINQQAIKKIAKGGILFTFSCSQAVSKEEFRLAVFTAAAQAGRKVRILDQLSQPADHPINIYHPEGEYLKGLILYVD